MIAALGLQCELYLCAGARRGPSCRSHLQWAQHGWSTAGRRGVQYSVNLSNVACQPAWVTS